LTHYNNGKGLARNLLNLLEIQWPGSQAPPVEHSSAWLGKDKQPTYRIIILGQPVCPSTHPSFESKLIASVDDTINILDWSAWIDGYVHTNVIKAILLPLVPTVAAAQETPDGGHPAEEIIGQPPKCHKVASLPGSETQDKINLSLPQYSDRYPKITPAEYDQLGICWMLPKGKLDITMWEAIQDPALIRELFLAGYMAMMEVDAGEDGRDPKVREVIPRLTENVPVPGENPFSSSATRKWFLRPGEYLQLSAVEQLAGIKSSDQSHPISHPRDPCISCLLLSQPYKNNMNLIKDTLNHFRLCRENLELPYYSESHSGMQQLFGFGGSTMPMGVMPPTPGSDSKNEAAAQVPVSQSFCSVALLSGAPGGLNERLHAQICLHKAIVLKFWNENLLVGQSTGFSEHMSEAVKRNLATGDESSRLATFVGYYSHYEYKHTILRTRRDVEEHEDMYKECPIGIKNLTLFRYREHNVFTMLPVFSNSDWDLIDKRE
jgi:hypothetical protein